MLIPQPATIPYDPLRTQPTKVAGTLRRAVRSQAFAKIPGGRHMECAYYFVDGTWNVPTTLTFVGCVYERNGRTASLRSFVFGN
jgi:hypothetical protein